MIKIVLGYIFVISTLLFYIYYGIRLTENFKTKTEILIYIFSYILLGITILNLVLVTKYWEVLSAKRGPPGPRGLMGEEGDSGHKGNCSLDHNIMFTLIQIKRGIAEELTSIDTELSIEEVYNTESNTLTNNTLDTIINRIVQSKEFDTILLRPDTLDTIKYGKSLEDIVGYLKSIIIGWARDIYKLKGGPKFFRSIDGSFTDTSEIEDYFHKEIEKYDIWYWNGTRVFKPLEIMVMRQTEYRGSDGKMHQNSAFPMDDKPRLEFLEIEYSDVDTSKLNFIWNAKGIGMEKGKDDDEFKNIIEDFKSREQRQREKAAKKAEKAAKKAEKKEAKEAKKAEKAAKKAENVAERRDNRNDKMYQKYVPSQSWNNWSNNNAGLYGTYRTPGIYMPKPVRKGGKMFYPLGCVLIEEDEGNKSAKIKKTVLVSGDVIIPTEFNIMWIDRVTKNVLKNGSWPSSGNYAAIFWKLRTNNPNYVVLGDIPQVNWNKSKRNDTIFLDNPLLSLEYLKTKLGTYKTSLYKGIVAIPKDLVKEIPAKDTPEWSQKLNRNPEYYHGGTQIDIFIGKGTEEEHNNIIRFQNMRSDMNLLDKGEKFYKINKDANKHLNNPLKATEPENNDLGFGYYGYPYLITDKYSIFKFLDLVPEGLIINYNNNRKLYIRHYGGADMNRYNIFKYDTKTGRYDKALRVNGPTNIVFSRMKPNDQRFGFSYEVDTTNPKFIRFKSILYPKKGYLAYISNITNTKYDSERRNRPEGVSIDHTKSTFILEEDKGEISNNNKKLFMFLQSHGRGLYKGEQPRLELSKMKYPGSKNTYTY
jgi:hypothetical protein